MDAKRRSKCASSSSSRISRRVNRSSGSAISPRATRARHTLEDCRSELQREKTMKYLCLVYGEEQAIQGMPDSHCLAYDEEIRASGYCIASEALQPVSTATTVRVRHGKVSVTDGPFAETKEYLAGFYLIEARDLNEAIQVAAKNPHA